MDIIETFKQVLHRMMIHNFQRDGYLVPVFFMMRDDNPNFIVIPRGSMSAMEYRLALSVTIKDSCRDLKVSCAGLILEAYSRTFKASDRSNELRKLLESGNIRVGDLRDKSDIIYMIFSTPCHEEIISYVVDPKTKTILTKMEGGKMEGIFSDFFEYRR
jgi:hypothetical protein